ncbi:MAG: histidine phosphatase family protein [Planctomycetes bacterium]|nr:histidine phosphatase family protein [Planctomycetota bacterium]
MRFTLLLVGLAAFVPAPQSAKPKSEARADLRVAPYADALTLPPPATGFRRVYVVRHGQSVGNVTPDDSKLTDAEKDHLTEKGRAEAVAAGELLKELHVAALDVSPMQRAQETAIAIGGCYPRRSPPRIVTQDGWRGLTIGKPTNPATPALAELAAAWRDGKDPRLAGGETLAELAARAKRRALEIAADEAASPPPIAIVAHSEIVAAWLADFDAAALPKLVASLRIPNGAIAAFDLQSGAELHVKRLGLFAPEEKPPAAPK